MSKEVRLGIAELAHRKCDVIRDYWRDLGNTVEYSKETHNSRRAVLELILEKYSISAEVLDKHDLFWTSIKKLWNPNHWSEKALEEAGVERVD